MLIEYNSKSLSGLQRLKQSSSKLALQLPGTKKAEFANRIDLDEVAHK